MFLIDSLLGIAAAGPQAFWTATVGGGAFSLGLVTFGFVQLSRARSLEAVPTSRVRSAAQGYVELNGHARLLPGPEILSPLSLERCCWWQYRVEQRQAEDVLGRRQARWVTVDQGSSDDLFLLDDGTGACVIDPVGARVVTDVQRIWRGAQRRPDRIPKPGRHFGFGEYRYTERLMPLGGWLYAIGEFRSQTAARYDDEMQDVSHLMAEWKRDRPQLLARFDANRDGQIDVAEWELARKAAFAEVRERQVERSVQPDLHVLGKPTDRRAFILSTRTEHQLTRGMRWGGFGGVVGGLLLGTAVLFLLVARGLL